MVQILIITNKGKFEAKPFSTNNPEAMTSEDLIESIPVGTNEQNQELQGSSDDGAQVIEAPAESSESETSD